MQDSEPVGSGLIANWMLKLREVGAFGLLGTLTLGNHKLSFLLGYMRSCSLVK